MPFAVLHSKDFVYDAARKNLTLEALQEAFVAMMNNCANATRDDFAGHSLWLIAGKGDWKFKKEWLRETRHYGKLQICRRCLADHDRKNWTDVSVDAAWDNDADRAIAMMTAVPDDVPMLGLASEP